MKETYNKIKTDIWMIAFSSLYIFLMNFSQPFNKISGFNYYFITIIFTTIITYSIINAIIELTNINDNSKT